MFISWIKRIWNYFEQFLSSLFPASSFITWQIYFILHIIPDNQFFVIYLNCYHFLYQIVILSVRPWDWFIVSRCLKKWNQLRLKTILASSENSLICSWLKRSVMLLSNNVWTFEMSQMFIGDYLRLWAWRMTLYRWHLTVTYIQA